jgi:hypothetical protein
VRKTSLVAALIGCSLTSGIVAVGTELKEAPSPRTSTQGAEKKVESLASIAPRLKKEVLRQALYAAEAAQRSGRVTNPDVLAVIDYSLPSSEPRLWVLDTRNVKLLYEELVSHGKNSGDNRTVRFSNVPESLMTSLGTFVTAGTYVGRNGYSLRLHGLESGFNDNALQRAIVMHGADYVSPMFVRQHGRLGRSWGCPAVRREVARPLIDRLAGGAVLFSYYPQPEWLSTSMFLDRQTTLAD